jgi:transcriptional regulator
MPEAALRQRLATVRAADLITPGPDGLIATFLPLLHQPDAGGHGRLLGHVARTNPHWRATEPGAESLVIVRGPDAYVSPSWYPAKQDHGRVVPTWNYVTMHVYGQLIAHDDVDWLRMLVERLTVREEAAFERPWRVSDAPAPYIEGQLRAIVGLELAITRIEAKSKLTQNRSAEDRAGVVAGLRGHPASGDAASRPSGDAASRPSSDAASGPSGIADLMDGRDG